MSGFRTNRLKPDLRPHQRKVGYFSREWSSEIDSFIAAARTFAGPSSGSTIGGNGVTTEISDQPPAQPSNCTSKSRLKHAAGIKIILQVEPMEL
jgi:hypothetical protein